MIQPAPIYPPNHIDTDGTLVRYHFEHRVPFATLTAGEQRHADANIRLILAEHGSHTRRRLFDATLHTWPAFDAALDILRTRGVVVCRDGEWRLAS